MSISAHGIRRNIYGDDGCASLNPWRSFKKLEIPGKQLSAGASAGASEKLLVPALAPAKNRWRQRWHPIPFGSVTFLIVGVTV